ncbi:MAG: hypothetical protein QOF70_4316, partial [Acetobacteraceae bacterium]|nr:hypothetical protein [Acetobacteraceae bacterium]
EALTQKIGIFVVACILFGTVTTHAAQAKNVVIGVNVFSDLKRRNIALAIEMGLLSGKDSAGQQACGVGVEGFAAPDNAKVVANRIQKAGGVLAYVAMDEPLWYAHHFSGKNACGWTMEDVARDIVPRVAALREKFPAVQIGDIEPVGTAQPPDWVAENSGLSESGGRAAELLPCRCGMEWAVPTTVTGGQESY